MGSQHSGAEESDSNEDVIYDEPASSPPKLSESDNDDPSADYDTPADPLYDTPNEVYDDNGEVT